VDQPAESGSDGSWGRTRSGVGMRHRLLRLTGTRRSALLTTGERESAAGRWDRLRSDRGGGGLLQSFYATAAATDIGCTRLYR
jgi:hypothetical protein